jgi:gamma-glutamyl phosphate reductase
MSVDVNISSNLQTRGHIGMSVDVNISSNLQTRGYIGMSVDVRFAKYKLLIDSHILFVIHI